MQLDAQIVVMGCTATNKQQALMQVAQALHKKGLVGEGYDEALRLREEQSNTYLGSGIAIPHGTPAYKDSVQKTGVVMLHFADGVDWGDGQTVYLAVGIAAKSDEHLGILRRLAHSLGDDDMSDKLKKVSTADEVAALFVAPDHKNTKPSQHTKAKKEPVKKIQTHLAVDNAAKLLLLAADKLDELGVANKELFAELFTRPLWYLSHHLWCLYVPADIPAILVLSAQAAFTHQDQSMQHLVVLAGIDNQKVDELLPRLLDLPENPSQSDYQAALEGDCHDYLMGKVVLANRHGLHARPATALAKLANTYSGEVLVACQEGEFVSAKSLTRLLGLGAMYGQSLTFSLKNSDDAQAMLDTLIAAVNAGLGEEVVAITVMDETADQNTAKQANNVLDYESKPLTLEYGVAMHGICASAGVAVAKAWVADEPVFDFAPTANDSEAEHQKLNLALQTVEQELKNQIIHAKTHEIADIFTAHSQLLADDELLATVQKAINQGASAAMAWQKAIDELVKAQAALDNPLLACRAADLADVGRQVLMVLCGVSIKAPSDDYVLIKEDLLPSDVAKLDGNVVAMITAVGGASSHSAIIARSLGIPAVVGAGAAVLQIATGEQVLVDASAGQYVVRPNEQMITAAKDKQAYLIKKQNDAKAYAHLPASTTDSHQVEVMVNLGDVVGGSEAVRFGADGVGLLRTEFVFMKHNKMPDIHTQMLDYSQVFEAMDSRPVVARTLDVGGDKPLPYLMMNSEDNPFLGVRGIRLSLNHPKLLKEQLTALIVASANRPLRIMFPMIGQMSEWHKARAMVDEVLNKHPHSDLQVGMMIEVPSAAIMADEFAKVVDFFSIGTNDLTQYTLAIDRGHPVLSAMADGLHPSVLRLIDNTIQAAHKHGKWVGVCGELGSDELAVPILVGLGVDELSVSASQIALVKAQIRTISFEKCRTLANQVLTCNDAKDVRILAQNFIQNYAQTTPATQRNTAQNSTDQDSVFDEQEL